MYDYLIVGAGMFGATFAEQASRDGKSCLVLDKRGHIGGNCYTFKRNSIDIHAYGAHIFHTNSRVIWEYISQFSSMLPYVHNIKVKYEGNIYSFPINLLTLYQIYGVHRPEEAKQQLEKDKVVIKNPANFEEVMLTRIGQKLYDIFIYGYTKKQWNTDPKNLPVSLAGRVSVRFNFDDNYFSGQYTGIPKNGYTYIFNQMLSQSDVILEEDYLEKPRYWNRKAKKIVYTGPIDAFFKYRLGQLAWRSLTFKHKSTGVSDFQGCSVVNIPNKTVKHTRVIEHKHFSNTSTQNSIVTYEYPQDWTVQRDRYYPIRTASNLELYNQYRTKINNAKYIFGGRLGRYCYYDMDQVIGSAIKAYKNQI